MDTDLVPVGAEDRALSVEAGQIPAIITAANKNAAFAYVEFFGAEAENPNTYRAYRNAVDRFLVWCERQGYELQKVGPAHVGAYIRKLKKFKRAGKEFVETNEPASKPTKKLHLAALRHFFDKLVVRHAIILNPALSVRGPKYSQREGKTPAFSSPKQARQLLESIDTSHVVGLRDRAVLGTFTFTGVRANAVAKLRRKDYYPDGNQHWFHFDEKGGKARTIPVRHDLQTFIDEYITAAGLMDAEGDTPLFRTAVGKTRTLTERPMKPKDILYMVKRRLKEAGLPARQLTTLSFRATVITDLLKQKVAVEDVQYLAGHSDPRTTLLYDHSKREVSRNIVERISI